MIKLTAEEYDFFLSLDEDAQKALLDQTITSDIIQASISSPACPIISEVILVKSFLDQSLSQDLFQYLLDHVSFQNYIKTRFGQNTRKSYRVDHGTQLYNYIFQYISEVSQQYNLGQPLGFYLNYYSDENDYTPNHSHRGTNQLVLSLGGSRILNIDKKNYQLENGDCILFGDHIHGVPKQKYKCQPRISIATFY